MMVFQVASLFCDYQYLWTNSAYYICANFVKKQNNFCIQKRLILFTQKRIGEMNVSFLIETSATDAEHNLVRFLEKWSKQFCRRNTFSHKWMK